MFEIGLRVGKPETRCDYRGVSGKQGAAKEIAGTVQGATAKRSKKAWRLL
ncbi:hypothetical protein DP44_786 [Burkholderia pseudomallei]|nr:hypothetical protein DP44_786 [Burkholderia pseudomallei]